MIRRGLIASLALATALCAPMIAQAQTAAACTNGQCSAKFTPDELLKKAEQLVLARHFIEAKPLIAALSILPKYELQTDFLTGYIAVETGDYKTGIARFRKILRAHPDQTRVRLELARALLLTGQDGAAEHHFRIAAQDNALPSDVRATISGSRSLLRDRRTWSFSLDLGLVPDTNINNGTTVEIVDFNLGGLTIPLQLGNQQRAQTGIGENIAAGGTVRLPMGKTTKLLVEADGNFTRYDNPTFNDLTLQLAVGPEWRLSSATTLSVEVLGNEHIYGATSAGTAEGVRTNFQHNYASGARYALTLDARRTVSGFADDYSGYEFAGYATYEKVMFKSLIGSATLFARRDALNGAPYASLELGGALGIGGELPRGINAGVNLGLSHADYDAALLTLSPDIRHDWRLNVRGYVGLRSIHVAGFSPSVSVTYNRNGSNYALYDSQRTRVRVGLMRYF